MYARRRFLSHAAAVSCCLIGEPRSWSAPAPRIVNEGGSKLVTPGGRKAIDAGLAFLAARQHADGSFGTNAWHGNVAITSLGAMAFVAAGHLPDAGDHAKVMGAALDFVLSQENRGGRHPGCFYNPGASPHGPMYNHGFATLCLVHFHDRIKNKERRSKVREALERALKLTVSVQNATGGWRYTPESRDADISVTSCQLMALIAARNAGHDVPQKTITAGVAYVKKCQDRDTGGFCYMLPLAGVPVASRSFARTAAGAAVLQATADMKGAEIDKAFTFIAKSGPTVQVLRPDMHLYFGHYYASQAFHSRGGKTGEDWYAAVAKELLGRQRPDGSWLDQICSHYATAMACLILLAPDARMAMRTSTK